MIQTRTRKIVADVLSRKGRTLLVAFSIMMGVFGVVVLVGMGDLLITQIEKDTPPETIAMSKQIVILPRGDLSAQDNRDIFRQMEADIPAIIRAEGQAIYQASWRLADAPEDERLNIATLQAFSEPWDEVQIEPIREVIEGRYPEVGQNEIAVEIRFADKYGVSVGDQLLIQPADLNAEAELWTVTGMVLFPYFILSASLTDNILAEDIIYANYDDAKNIAGFQGVNRIYTRSEDFETSVATGPEASAYILSKTPYISVFNFPEDPNDTLLVQQVGQVTDILSSLAMVAMFVSGFLVINVINTIVIEQRQQIGVLKSLGASQFDVIFIYAGIAFIYGVIGTILGLVLGIPATNSMSKEVARQAFVYIDGFRISSVGVGAGVILGLLVPVLVSIIPVIIGTRVTILEAMTDLGISSNWGTGSLSRFVRELPFPILVRQSLANVLQKAGRLSLTGFTLMLATASFIGVTAVLISLEAEVATFYSTNYEAQVELQNVQDFETSRQKILAVDGVENVSPGFRKDVGISDYVAPESDVLYTGTNQVLTVGVPPDRSVVDFDLLSGRLWEDDEEGVIISRTLSRLIDKDAGDSLIVELDGQSTEFEILGVHNFSFAAIWLRWDTLAAMAGFVDETGNPAPNNYYVALDGDDPTIDQTNDMIAKIDPVLRENGIFANFVNQVETAQEQADQLAVFGFLFNLTAGVMAAVGGIGLLATLSMAVFERQKEIGVMRSIGAGSGTIILQFLMEGILVGVISWVIALPFSYMLGLGLLSAMPFPDMQYTFPATLPFVGLLGIILVTLLASFWPSMMAARKTVSDILRYQ